MAENSILCPISMTSWFDPATGQPKQANAFFYKAQTLDPIVVYTDAALSIPFPQPVVTSGYARMPPIYVGEIVYPGYRIRVFDQWQVLIEDLDMLPAAVPTVPPPAPDVVDPSSLARTGDMKAMWSNHAAIDGWVECSGKSIGSTISNATGRANDDTHDLFVWLWQQDAVAPNHLLEVLPQGKGGSAEGDWLANKTIATPDLWGRLIGGMDGYDAANSISVSGRLDAGVFELLPTITEADKPYQPSDYQKPWMLGGPGGESVHKLVVTELAVHLHDWVDSHGHTHTVVDPGHVHGVTDPKHTHSATSSAPDSDNILVRTDSASRSITLAGGANDRWYSGGMDLSANATGISIQSNVTGTYLKNWNAASGQTGYGTQLQYIGTWDATAGKLRWHNPTENFPLPNDGSNGTDMGDVPHNTLPPFLLVCWYIKL
jgi:hypothetical protein